MAHSQITVSESSGVRLSIAGKQLRSGLPSVISGLCPLLRVTDSWSRSLEILTTAGQPPQIDCSTKTPLRISLNTNQWVREGVSRVSCDVLYKIDSEGHCNDLEVICTLAIADSAYKDVPSSSIASETSN